jgi:hypothetical protein
MDYKKSIFYIYPYVVLFIIYYLAFYLHINQVHKNIKSIL